MPNKFGKLESPSSRTGPALMEKQLITLANWRDSLELQDRVLWTRMKARNLLAT